MKMKTTSPKRGATLRLCNPPYLRSYVLAPVSSRVKRGANHPYAKGELLSSKELKEVRLREKKNLIEGARVQVSLSRCIRCCAESESTNHAARITQSISTRTDAGRLGCVGGEPDRIHATIHTLALPSRHGSTSARRALSWRLARKIERKLLFQQNHRMSRKSRPLFMKTSKNKTHSKNSTVPKVPSEFSSMAQASAYLGMPKSTLRFASKSGADAFRNGRVQTLALIRWIFSQDENTQGIDYRDRLVHYQSEREKLKLSRERGETADKSVILFGLNQIISQFFNGIDRLFTVELPPALRGLDEMAMHTVMKAHAEKLKTDLRASLLALANAEKAQTED